MTQVYFHCSNTRGVLMDRRGASVDNLSEACEAATRMMRSLVATVSLEDWRDWAVHVSDEAGEEIVILPSPSCLANRTEDAPCRHRIHHAVASRGLNAVTSAWQKLIARMCDPYRPEQHYMRGPGPRCRAKHAVHAAPAG